MPPSAANQAFNSAAAVFLVTMGVWMAAVVYEHLAHRLPWKTDLVTGFAVAVLAGLLEAAVGGFLRLDSPVGLLTALLLVLAAYKAEGWLFEK